MSRPLRLEYIHVRYGYTLKEIGEHLGIHYTTVSKTVSRSEEATNQYFKT